MFGGDDFEYLQAPVWTVSTPGLPNPPMSYGEVLMHFGFLNERGLKTQVKGWRNLMTRVEPALLIADHAPTSLLAAYTLGLPSAMLGTGFFSPPRVSPFPCVRPWLHLPEQRFVDGEKKVLQTVNSTLEGLGIAPLPNLAELFRNVNEDFLLTLPELDHYGERSDATYWGPINSLGQGVSPRWPAGDGPRVFVYLKGDVKYLAEAARQVSDLEWPTIFYAGERAEELEKEHGAPNICFSAEPLDLNTVAGESDVAVCHGGQGTVTAFLLHGKPLVLFPTQAEQRMLGKNVMTLGAADMVVPGKNVSALGERLARVVNSPLYRRSAERFAEKHKGLDQDELIERICDRCAQLVSKNKRRAKIA